MKRIFAGAGILVALFSIFFFLLIADKMVFHNNETIYDFKLSQNISGQELKAFAESADVTIRLVNFDNTSFGKNDLVVTFINPDSSISLGKQPSVFPKEKIVYKVLNEKIPIKIKMFTVQSNDYNKIVNIKSLLEKNGFSVDLIINEPIKFGIGMLFSSLNLGFFALLTLLLTLSIATYYVYRLKEIGVLKLNGWSNGKISFRLLFELLFYLYLSSLLFAIPFGIYVAYSDVSKIILYAKIYLLLCFFLALVFLLSAFVGTFFINNVNQVGAIKNKRNNKLIFYILLLFKIVITISLILSMNNSTKDILILDSTIQEINKLEKYDYYMIHTSVIPEEALHKKLDQLIGSLDDKDVYNYRPASNILNIIKLKAYQLRGKLRDSDEYAYTYISPNMLEVLDILNEKGNKIEMSQIDINANTLLVPIHCKNDIDNILEHFHLGKDTEIIYIQNGQVQNDILMPGYFAYDSIYSIHKVKKTLYVNSGEVLLNKESANIIEQVLINLGIDTNSIRIDSLNNDYNIVKGNIQLNFYESLFHVTINALSFFLCVISIVTIFLELRKKELGVYKLVGKYPIKVIGKFVVLSCLITILITLVVNPIFLPLLFVEGIVYWILIFKYMKSKAVLTLKGE